LSPVSQPVLPFIRRGEGGWVLEGFGYLVVSGVRHRMGYSKALISQPKHTILSLS
jgi:hypothetical protein